MSNYRRCCVELPGTGSEFDAGKQLEDLLKSLGDKNNDTMILISDSRKLVCAYDNVCQRMGYAVGPIESRNKKDFDVESYPKHFNEFGENYTLYSELLNANIRFDKKDDNHYTMVIEDIRPAIEQLPVYDQFSELFKIGMLTEGATIRCFEEDRDGTILQKDWDISVKTPSTERDYQKEVKKVMKQLAKTPEVTYNYQVNPEKLVKLVDFEIDLKNPSLPVGNTGLDAMAGQRESHKREWNKALKDITTYMGSFLEKEGFDKTATNDRGVRYQKGREEVLIRPHWYYFEPGTDFKCQGAILPETMDKLYSKFQEFCQTHSDYMITGSDEKTVCDIEKAQAMVLYKAETDRYKNAILDYFSQRDGGMPVKDAFVDRSTFADTGSGVLQDSPGAFLYEVLKNDMVLYRDHGPESIFESYKVPKRFLNDLTRQMLRDGSLEIGETQRDEIYLKLAEKRHDFYVVQAPLSLSGLYNGEIIVKNPDNQIMLEVSKYNLVDKDRQKSISEHEFNVFRDGYPNQEQFETFKHAVKDELASYSALVSDGKENTKEAKKLSSRIADVWQSVTNQNFDDYVANLKEKEQNRGFMQLTEKQQAFVDSLEKQGAEKFNRAAFDGKKEMQQFLNKAKKAGIYKERKTATSLKPKFTKKGKSQENDNNYQK